MKINTNHQKLGRLLFSLGALIGLFFTGFATWADFEAYMFDVAFYSDASLPTLRCPIIISPKETGTIHASVTNTTENNLTRRIRVHVGHELVVLMREESVILNLAPGETQKLEWKINSEDVVWERLILARVYLYRSYPLPSRSSACGVIVTNVLGLPGARIVVLVIAASFLSMIAGILVRKNRDRLSPRTKRRFFEAELSMQALAVIIIAGILTTLLGLWIAGAILVVIATLLIVTVLAQSVL